MSLQYRLRAAQFCPIPTRNLPSDNRRCAPPLPKEETVNPADPRLADKSTQRPGLLARALTLLVTAGLLVLGFMFSLLLVAFAVAVALLAGGYLWWQTRRLRRHLREQTPGGVPRQDAAAGTVFEGEAVRVDAADEEGDERGPELAPGRGAERPGRTRGEPHPERER